jgi:hypothetical protein
MAKSGNGGVDLIVGLMKRNMNGSIRKPQNKNMYWCMWFSEQNVTELYKDI